MSEAYVPASMSVPVIVTAPSGIRVGNRSLVHVSGDLDCTNASQLAVALAPLVAGGGHIGVDLAAMRFMDVRGLNVLHEAAAALGERGQLVLYDPPPAAGNLIRLSGLAGMVVVDDHHTARSRHRRRSGGVAN